MKRKLLSLALSFALCLTLLPGVALAADDKADTWDGTADINWYTGHEDDQEYHISTAEQLAGLAELVNADPGKTNFAGKVFYLENDLDLSGHEWISIGTGRGGTGSKYAFCGVFDGQNHVVSNLYSHESYIENADESHNLLRNALFGNVYDGEIKNLGVENAEIWIDPLDDSAAGKGILVDWMGKSSITNCWTSGSIESGSKIEKNIGGIVGVTVQGCTISGCYSTATLTGNFTNSEGNYTEPDPADWPSDTIGGIVGAQFDGDLTVTDCWFGGKIVVNSLRAAVAGIIGYADDATLVNCMVTAKDMDVDSGGNTCWMGYMWSGTVENNYWPDDEKAYDPSPLEFVGGAASEDQGTAVSDFTADAVLAGLQAHTGSGITWVAGIDHPTFDWDSRNIVADYTAVYAAIKAARAVDGTLYANYSDVQDAIDAVEYNKSKADQAQVNAMAQAVEDAVAKLTYRSADYTKVDEAVAKADALNEADYTDFSAVKAALEAVDRTKNITQQAEVDAMAQAIEDAVSGLTRKSTGSDRDDSSSTPSYPVTAPDKADNGSVSVSPKNAIQGSTVTVKVTPDSGYVVDRVTVTDNRGNEVKLTQKGVGTYTFTMPAGQVTVTAAFAPAAEQSPFRDVSASDYYYDAVKWAAEEGITSGTSADLFSPSAPCTRAQMVTFLWRAAGSPDADGALTFTDVADSAYYAPAVRWAASVGVTSGTGAGRFSPDDPCTRGQMAAFLYRWQQSPAASGSNPFADVADSDYYYAAVLWAYQKGVTQGVSASAFAPSAPCTRGQMAMFLYQLKG